MKFKEVVKYAAKITKMEESPLREKFEEMFEEMAVHTRMRKPDDLLLKRRPNEAADVLCYRTENYEAITYGSMNKAFDNLNRILTGIHYKMHINNDDVSNYLTKKKFERNTFDMFFSRIYLKRMIEDANGLLLWLPGGEGTTNSSASVQPYPKLIFSFDIIDWDDEIITVLSDEKTFITDKEGNVIKNGVVYYILTKNEFYKHSQVDVDKFELKLIYTHNIGELPIIPMGGDLNADGYYESFFAPYIAFGNEAIRQFSDWQALSVMAAHPIREEFFTECEMQSVEKKGKGKADDDENETYSRQVELRPFARGPFSVIQRPIGESNPNGIGDSFLPYTVPTVRFINPDVAFVQNAEKSYKNLLELAEDALHLNLGDVSLSGKAKEIDLLSHEDMLTKIASQLLDSKQMSLRFITAYMTNKTFDECPVKLIKPSTFRVRDEIQLTDELNKLKTNNAPAMLVSAVARELAALRFSGDEINQKIFEIVATYDPLFTYSITEKQSMVLSGLVSKEDAIKSALIYSILLNISKTDGDAAFMETPNEKIFEKFLTEAEKYSQSDFKITDNLGN